MKKIICLLLVSILTVCAVGCGETESTSKEMDGVFRYADWGDSAKSIKAKEGAECAETETGLLVKDIMILNSYKADAYYHMDDGKFIGGMYAIKSTYEDNLLYAFEFKTVNKALKEKYGEPAIDLEKDLEYKYTYNTDWADGDCGYFTMWKTENATIHHRIESKGSEIKHDITYTTPIKDEINTSGI